MQIATPTADFPNKLSSGSLGRTGGFVLRHKWLWPIVAAVLLAAVGWLVRTAVETSIKSLLADKLQTILDADVAALRTWLDAHENVANSWAYDPILRGHLDDVFQHVEQTGAGAESLLAADATRRLHDYLHPYMPSLGYEGYVIFAADETIVASDRRELIGRRGVVSFRPFVAAAIEGRATVSRPFPSVAVLSDGFGGEAAGSPTMFAAAPLTDDDGEVFAVVALRIRPQDEFSTLLRAARAGESGETYAFDANGLLLSESRFESQLKQIGLIPDRPESFAMLQVEVRDPGVNMTLGVRPAEARADQPLTTMAAAAVRGAAGVDIDGYNDYRGVPVVGAWTWLPEYGFGVTTEIDVEEAFESVYVLRATFWALFGLLVASAVVLLLSMFAMSRLRRLAVRESRKAKRLGQYQLDEKIGEGGMGEVYRAHHAMLVRPTAVKLLKADKCNPVSLARFEREVQLSSQLTHPNTIQVYDYGRTDGGEFYYAMEYLEGVNLGELIRSDGPLPASRAIHILAQVCGSLAEAHDSGLIHRDIKPANIMVTCRGGVPDFTKVLDFGLVKETESRSAPTVTVADAIAGTPLYFSPEATRGTKELDQRSDIYSLGVVAYEMLAGRPPFDGDSAIEVCMMHVSAPVPPLPEIAGRFVPDELKAILAECLEKSPVRRPSSVHELRARLLEVVETLDDWDEADSKEWWARRHAAPPAERDLRSSSDAMSSTDARSLLETIHKPTRAVELPAERAR